MKTSRESGVGKKDFLLSPEAPAWEKLESLHPPRGEGGGTSAGSFSFLTEVRGRGAAGGGLGRRGGVGGHVAAYPVSPSPFLPRNSPSLWKTWTLSATAARTLRCALHLPCCAPPFFVEARGDALERPCNLCAENVSLSIC